MTQEALAQYLTMYFHRPQILRLDQIPEPDQKKLPHSWIEILAVDGEKRVLKTIEQWRNFEAELSQVIEYMKKNLLRVSLIHHETGYSLVYEINSSSGNKILCYEGRNPIEKKLDQNMEKHWPALPEQLRKFYDTLHNGWFYLASGSMGLSPVEDFFFLDEDEWQILEELETPLPNLSKTVSVYTNGMGGYVCLELTTYQPECLLWWKSNPPVLNLDLWPVVDSWTTMGFEE
ncbi:MULTISPECIES: hypothetical protein [unclassified Modicisalibacter]|uniref:hypothetical protein n=1 Tax=unclassified Modicisalibacter TaxID=2679913 RepID=UPI001CCFED1F|nr:MULTISPECIES: hypothetical protein [unclassified Modicisalibacter]MBZ9558061.1 hypothetical protein [Modicisalibacter sp. R2A 31.J]MBZ9573270.1 hypothetical protein [Modicisalibacter sp. MOD 31.J]